MEKKLPVINTSPNEESNNQFQRPTFATLLNFKKSPVSKEVGCNFAATFESQY